MTGKGHQGCLTMFCFLISMPVMRTVFLCAKSIKLDTLLCALACMRVIFQYKVYFWGKNRLPQNRRIFNCMLCPHLTAALLVLCRSSSCSNLIYPGSTFSHSGIRTQCSPSISFKVLRRI